MTLRIALCLLSGALIHCASVAPTPIDDPVVSTPLAKPSQPAVGTFKSPRIVDVTAHEIDDRRQCPPGRKTPTFGPEGTFACRGLPFELWLPHRPPFEQTYGNGFVSLQRGSAKDMVAVSFAALPWTLYPKYQRTDADSFTQKFLKAIGARGFQLGAVQPWALDNTVYAGHRTFSFGNAKNPVEGVSHYFVTRGWFVNVMVGGHRDQPLHRDGKQSANILKWIRVVDKPRGVPHRFPSGTTMIMPPESWPKDSMKTRGHVREWLYVWPMTGALITISEAQAPGACDSLGQEAWRKVAGETSRTSSAGGVRFLGDEWLLVGKTNADSGKSTRVLLSRAEVTGKRGKVRPALAALACRQGRFFQVLALDDHQQGVNKLRAEVLRMVGTLPP